jgi:hypothetical protein
MMSPLLLSCRNALALLLALPLLAACAGTPGAAPASSTRPETLRLEIPDDSFGSGPFVLEDPQVGLPDLASYTATLTMAFDGTRDGLPEKTTKTYVMQVSSEPAYRQLTIETDHPAFEVAAVYRAETSGTAYERLADGACIANPVRPGFSLGDRLEPASFLLGPIGADEAGAETIGEVETLRYTFDEKALSLQGVTEAKGEVWIAAEGGYVVKYVLTQAGESGIFAEGLEGTLTYDYTLTSIDQTAMIELPADCPAPRIDAPLLPDASNVVNQGGALTYQTASSVPDATAFYQEQLLVLGWQPQGEPGIEDGGAILPYQQEQRTLTVILWSSDGATFVQVVIGKIEE